METLDAFWRKPGEATAILGNLRRDNEDLYRFEEKLEGANTKAESGNSYFTTQ
jgi:hypothetical protein